MPCRTSVVQAVGCIGTSFYLGMLDWHRGRDEREEDNMRLFLFNELSPQTREVGLVRVVLGPTCLRNHFNCHTKHD